MAWFRGVGSGALTRREMAAGNVGGESVFGMVSVSINPPMAELSLIPQKIVAKLFDCKKVWRALLPDIHESFAEIWASRGGAIGVRWPRNSEKYQERKRKENFGSESMVRTGDLFRQLTTRDGVIQLTGRTLRFGSRQQGTFPLQSGSKGRGPAARPFVGITSRLRATAERLLAEHMVEVVRKAMIVQAWQQQQGRA